MISLRLEILGVCRGVKASSIELQSSTYTALFLDRQQIKGFVLSIPSQGSKKSVDIVDRHARSVNYLFGRPLIPSDFLKRIVTSLFRDMRNLMFVVFEL